MFGNKVQNIAAGLVFAILFASAASMQLLTYYPASEALWYINLNYAREARPVLELFDYLPLAGPMQNMLIIASLIGLCGIAIVTNRIMLTSATTHTALYLTIFAGIASSSRTFHTFESASLFNADVRGMASAMDPSQLALTGLVVLLFVSCLFNHYQIISDMVQGQLSKAKA